jgi:hypothetical protein
MVEVFKTNVISPVLAYLVVHRIHNAFPDHRANFDLQDCDHILRVVCAARPVQAGSIMDLLQAYGIDAEPLPDEVPPGKVFTTADGISQIRTSAQATAP